MNPVESNAESTVECGNSVPEASEESKEFTSNSTRGDSYVNLLKNLGTFYSCLFREVIKRCNLLGGTAF